MRKALPVLALLAAGFAGMFLSAPRSLAQEIFAFDCSGGVCIGTAAARDVFLLANGNRRLKVDRDGPITVAIGSGTAMATMDGTLTTSTTSACTPASLVETDLWTYSLPASTLSVNGRGVRVTAWGTTAATATTKTIKLYFGSTVISNPGAAVYNNVPFRIVAEVLRSGAATQASSGGSLIGAAALALVTTPSETLSGAITIKVSGQNGTANLSDVCFSGATVEAM